MNSQRIIAIVIRHLYIWPRSFERWMGALGWPFFDLVIWGLTISYLQKYSQASFSLLTFMLGGLIFWTIVWRVQNDISVNFLDEAWNKNLAGSVNINSLFLSFFLNVFYLLLVLWFFRLMFEGARIHGRLVKLN
jgi:hypothetical protein